MSFSVLGLKWASKNPGGTPAPCRLGETGHFITKSVVYYSGWFDIYYPDNIVIWDGRYEEKCFVSLS